MKSTLDFINQDRRIGNTTRIVDKAIQMLFYGEEVIVEDHYQNGKHRQANEMLMKRIMMRLHNEHPHITFETGSFGEIIFIKLKNHTR